MKGRVIPISNSKGIHIPRAGWDAAFEAMHQRQEDRLLYDGCLDLALGAWEWPSANIRQ